MPFFTLIGGCFAAALEPLHCWFYGGRSHKPEHDTAPMKTLRNLVRPRLKSPVVDLVGRFLQVFESHGVDLSQVPRLIPQIKYEDLQSEGRLIAALTPAAIDATAALFGVRRQWLEGLDDLMLQPFWIRRDPMGVLTRLAAVFTGCPRSKSVV